MEDYLNVPLVGLSKITTSYPNFSGIDTVKEQFIQLVNSKGFPTGKLGELIDLKGKLTLPTGYICQNFLVDSPEVAAISLFRMSIRLIRKIGKSYRRINFLQRLQRTLQEGHILTNEPEEYPETDGELEGVSLECASKFYSLASTTVKNYTKRKINFNKAVGRLCEFHICKILEEDLEGGGTEDDTEISPHGRLYISGLIPIYELILLFREIYTDKRHLDIRRRAFQSIFLISEELDDANSVWDELQTHPPLSTYAKCLERDLATATGKIASDILDLRHVLEIIRFQSGLLGESKEVGVLEKMVDGTILWQLLRSREANLIL